MLFGPMKVLAKDLFQHNKGIIGKGSDGNQAWLAEGKIRKETERCFKQCCLHEDFWIGSKDRETIGQMLRHRHGKEKMERRAKKRKANPPFTLV